MLNQIMLDMKHKLLLRRFFASMLLLVVSTLYVPKGSKAAYKAAVRHDFNILTYNNLITMSRSDTITL